MRALIGMIALLVLTCGARAGEFLGTLQFTPPGCEKSGTCFLGSDFSYKDSSGAGWETKAGDKTDGASIPPPLQPYIGHPFDADLIRAAVIHDHYCDRHVRSWSDTHWVFYDALLASGVEKRRAQKMYAGVLLGGPKWIWLIVGDSCHLVQNCIMQVPSAVTLPKDGRQKSTPDGRSLVVRPARYDAPEFAGELKKAGEEIDKLPATAERAQIEALVRSIRSEDKFITGPQAIVLRLSLGMDR